MARAQFGGGALRVARRRRWRRRAQGACAFVEPVVALGRGSALLCAAGAAMAESGNPLKEQKYDRQLR